MKSTDVKCSAGRRKKGGIMSELFDDYCSSTSLHGIGYLGAKDKSYPEKVWWILVFVLSLASCTYLITKTWIKWKTDPVILSFEKEQIPIWDIPFPAVTVCPVNKVRRKIYNYTELFRKRDNLTDEEYKEFWDISLVCNLQQYDTHFNCTLNTTDETVLRNILHYAPDADYSIAESMWQNYKQYDLFTNQITEEGVCFTFNTLTQDDIYTSLVTSKYIWHNWNANYTTLWNIETGYSSKIKTTDYPRRTTKDGITSGLSFRLGSYSEDIDYVCGMAITGYKIILHNPAEVPKAAQQYFMVANNRKSNIIIKPELTKTSKALQNLPPETRKCYFQKEKSLMFFKVYTQTNCRMECDANITLQYCKCVPFYLPHTKGTPICGFASNKCIQEVKRTIIDVEMTDELTKIREDGKERIEYTREIYNKCNCLPSCNSLLYSAEISHSDYHLVDTILASGLYDNELKPEFIEQVRNGLFKFTHVDIFFKDSEFYALKRSEIYGRVDFLANIGGLLGLFMGFSLLSLLEIVYFLTIRVWFKYKNRNKNI